MAGSTDHYGLMQLGAGEAFSTDGYKYTEADRQTIDNLLYLGAEGHKHTGTAGSIEEPDTAPDLELNSSGGTIPAGTRVYYKYTYVNVRGEESAASPEAFLDTPNSVDDPAAPSPSYTHTGGVLQGGNYYYVLTAYVDASIQESKATNPAFITIPATTATNEITLELPDLPDFASGFNVYRRKPGQTKYFYLDTIDMQVATPPSTYVDDGSVEEDCDRTLPKVNTTNSTNSIDITLPGATPAAPEGYTWKLYRTYITASWSDSLLVHVVENISEASTTITPTYLDIGISTQDGIWPTTSLVVGNPSKIDLTDGAEVMGDLPMGAFPFQHSFQWAGPLDVEPVQGSAPFICEFPQAEIVHVRAALGRGSSPASTSVIVDINKAPAGAAPSYSTVFTTQANRPVIAVGDQFGDPTTPDTILLERGDSLTLDIDQIGGGATPTDRDLVVTVYMIAYGYPATSYVEGSSGGTGGDF